MSTTDAYEELRHGFLDPPREYSPVGIWWWCAERVELDRLCEQLDELASQGVHNVLPVNLAPAGPQYGAQADDPPRFSHEWWELWRGICEHAKGLGTRIWFYDQIGFGGSNSQGELVTAEPSFAGATVDRISCDTTERCELTCPPTGVPISACVLPLDADGAVAGPPVALAISGGRTVWEPVGSTVGTQDHRVILAFARREGFDYLSMQACARLLDSSHGEFERQVGKYFGDVIVGSFQDELPDLPTWSASFADEFAERCGYRIEPVIAALWDDWGPESGRVRVDYQTVRGALAEAALFEPLWRWHDARGLVFGCDQQSPSRAGEPRGSVRQYADYCRTHRWFSAPGSDHWGDAKIHSSLAHHYQRPRTWIEAFHTTGWGGTLEETFDWLVPWVLAGANLYSPHAVYYSTHGGWWEWAPPSTCWRQPYWRHYRQFADAVTRLCWTVTRGDHVCDVGVLYPTTTVQAGTVMTGVSPAAEQANRRYLDLVGHMVWFYSSPGCLGRAGIDFDVLDDDTVSTASVASGLLQATAESYQAVVVPACRTINAATAVRLAEFAESGGTLVFVDCVPDHVLGAEGDSIVERLHSVVADGRAHLVDTEGVVPVLRRIPAAVTTEGVSLRRRIGDRHLLVVPAAATGTAMTQPMMPWVGELAELGGADGQRMVNGYLVDIWDKGYEFRPDRYRHVTKVRIDGGATDVEQWDVSAGRPRRPNVRRVDGATEVDVDFSAAPVAVITWRDGDPEESEIAAEQADGEWRELAMDDGWISTIVPTMDNRHGDLAWPPSAEPIPVQQWRLRHRVEAAEAVGAAWHEPDADDGDWESVLVGHGTWAWRLGPLDADSAPAPLSVGHRGRLDAGAGWEPVNYSLSNGIEKDPIHSRSLGPKGRVPDDFWHVDEALTGEVVCLRTSLPVEVEQDVTLAVAANGIVEVWWNGVKLPDGYEGHLRLDPVHAHAGHNLLEVRVRAESDGPLRGYWALTTDAEAFARPHWLVPGDGVVSGSLVSAHRTIRLDSPPVEATMQLGTEGVATLHINGREVASQGGFDPYGNQVRVIPYQVAQFLHAGANEMTVTIADSGQPVALFLDGVVEEQQGRRTTVVSDESWTFDRDGRAVPTRLRRAQRSQPYDSQWSRLSPRPHPLARAGWLETDPVALDSTVLDLVPDATLGAERPAEWFRIDVPPGATRVQLPSVAGSMRLWLDGEAVQSAGGVVELTGDGRRLLAARVEPSGGATGGALWDGPLCFEMGEGELPIGAWDAVGLGAYSGGVRYRRHVHVDAAIRQAVIDLGSVRGTAEVIVNGGVAGVRIWSPYRVDVTDWLVDGDNEIVVTVFNTLGPYIDVVSPTRLVLPGQRLSGLLGPVRLAMQ